MSLTEHDDVEALVKTFILSEFLPGESPEALTDETPLLTTGVLDSISTLKLVSFLEERFGITIEAHETGVEQLNTVTSIARLVRAKQHGGGAA
jgi:acyl carrier protein